MDQRRHGVHRGGEGVPQVLVSRPKDRTVAGLLAQGADHRIAATAPLNHDSRHLPPEMRDFRLRFDDVDWSRLGAPNNKVTLNELTLFEFNGGNQDVAAVDNMLHLPQFREHVCTSNEIKEGGLFDFEYLFFAMHQTRCFESKPGFGLTDLRSLEASQFTDLLHRKEGEEG